MSEYKYKLALSIVTANRHQQVKNSLNKIHGFLVKNNLAIYIFDGGTNNNLETFVSNMNYENVHYFYYHPEKTEIWRRFYDRKHIPDSEFVWTLSDQRIPGKSTILNILEHLDPENDLIVVNTMDVKRTQKFCTSNHVDFFREVCWHMQLLGANIVGRRIIDKCWSINRTIKEMTAESSHIEFREIFYALSTLKHANCVFTEYQRNPYLESTIIKISSTISEDRMFFTFIDKVILSLKRMPSEYNVYKKDVLKSMSTKTYWFTVDGFCQLNYLGVLHTDQCLKYYKKLKKVSYVHPIIIIIISVLPKELAAMIRDYIRKGREWKNRKY